MEGCNGGLAGQCRNAASFWLNYMFAFAIIQAQLIKTRSLQKYIIMIIDAHTYSACPQYQQNCISKRQSQFLEECPSSLSSTPSSIIVDRRVCGRWIEYCCLSISHHYFYAMCHFIGRQSPGNLRACRHDSTRTTHTRTCLFACQSSVASTLGCIFFFFLMSSSST